MPFFQAEACWLLSYAEFEKNSHFPIETVKHTVRWQKLVDGHNTLVFMCKWILNTK